MAIWSSDWSVLPLCHPKSPSKALLSITLPHVLSITSSNSYRSGRFVIINSSNSSSPLLHDSSNNLQIIHFPSDSATRQQDPVPDLDISNEFIRALCNNPQTQILAFQYYQKAKDQLKFRPEQPTVNLLTKTLLRSKQWDSISALSQDFMIFDVFPTRSTCSRLITCCIESRKYELAESLLRILEPKKGIAGSAFGSAMRGYNKLHMYSSTVLLFDRMRIAGISPNSSCYYWAMDAHRRLGDTDKVLSLFLEFESKKWDSSPFASQVYSVLCDSLGRSGRAFEALRYFREMEGKGVTSRPCFYASLICSFAGVREAEIAEDLFREARDKGMLKDPAVFLKLVLMYVEVGSVEKTLGILEAMKEMGMRVSDCILSAVVNGYVRKKGLRAAVRAIEQFKALGCQPGQVTYASIINVYCRLGLYQKAESVFGEMMEKGFDRCVVAYSNMISIYGKAGKVREAMRLLAKMKEKGCQPNVWVYNSLMDMHGRLRNLRQVEKLWKEMNRRGIAPDKISYTSIISAYSKARQFEECLRLYQEFKMNGGKVDRVLAAIMVGVFSKCSRVNELLMLLNDMKLEGTEMDERLYESSLNALRDAGLQVHGMWLKENFGVDKGKT